MSSKMNASYIAFYRKAIPQRNDYMVQNASVAICYVKHPSSGSFKTMQNAESQGLTIINVSS